MQRGIDGRRPRVQVKGRVTIHSHHVILDLGFDAVRARVVVDLLEGNEFILIKRGKVLNLRSPEIATGSFDPKHFSFFTGERIDLHRLGRSVSTSRVGDALVGAEDIGTIGKALDSAHGSDF